MSSAETWNEVPLSLLIMRILDKRDGIVLEHDLVNLLEKEIDSINKTRLNKELMKLEIHGKISVTRIKKKERKITLLSEDARFLPIGED
ncbi:MAG: hypothetical protein ACXADA_04245 [Candidatus Hodarchaeales archaeon]|jgi:hypothetical protein